MAITNIIKFQTLKIFPYKTFLAVFLIKLKNTELFHCAKIQETFPFKINTIQVF